MQVQVRKVRKSSVTDKPEAVAREIRPAEGYASVFRSSHLERVEMIREGVPAMALVETSKEMDWPRERLYDALHLPRATVARKIAAKSTLSPEMSERVIGLRKLIGQVEVMAQEAGSSAQGFDAAKWLASWLNSPSAALGGKKPGDFIDTSEGRDMVAQLLSQMQSGAYA